MHRTKYYYGSVKKGKFSFSCHLQIGTKKKTINVPRRKTDSNFKFIISPWNQLGKHDFSCGAVVNNLKPFLIK